jgi:hypothetical protein
LSFDEEILAFLDLAIVWATFPQIWATFLSNLLVTLARREKSGVSKES